MKAIATGILLVLAIIPLSTQASISSDMVNPNYTLVEVVQHGLQDGKAMDNIVAEMIKADMDQSSASIATALIVSPGDYEKIILASIGEGVSCSDVVAIALVATDEAMSEQVVEAAIRACPDQESEIKLCAVAVKKYETDGIPSSNGGAGNSAQEFRQLQATLDASKAVSDAVEDQKLVVAQSQAEVATATLSYSVAVEEHGIDSPEAIAQKEILDESLLLLQAEQQKLAFATEQLNNILTKGAAVGSPAGRQSI